VQQDQTVSRPVNPVRHRWEEASKTMGERGDDELLDEALVSTAWDEEEWEW